MYININQKAILCHIQIEVETSNKSITYDRYF